MRKAESHVGYVRLINKADIAPSLHFLPGPRDFATTCMAFFGRLAPSIDLLLTKFTGWKIVISLYAMEELGFVWCQLGNTVIFAQLDLRYR